METTWKASSTMQEGPVLLMPPCPPPRIGRNSLQASNPLFIGRFARFPRRLATAGDGTQREATAGTRGKSVEFVHRPFRGINPPCPANPPHPSRPWVSSPPTLPAGSGYAAGARTVAIRFRPRWRRSSFVGVRMNRATACAGQWSARNAVTKASLQSARHGWI